MRSTYRSLAWTLLLFFFCATSALAATITGTLTNSSGPLDARVYVQAQRANWGEANIGVSVPAGATSFTIRGLDDGVYVFRAFMDVTGTGEPHSTDPLGASMPVTISAGGTSIAGLANISLTVDSPDPVVIDPDDVKIAPGDGMVFLYWETPRINMTNLKVLGADHYRIEWSVDNFATEPLDSKAFVAEADVPVFIAGLTATEYQFRIVSIAGDIELTSASIPVTVGVPAGTAISGTVTLSGVTPLAGAPLYVLAFSEVGQPRFVKIAAPVAGSNDFTIFGVPAGQYEIVAVLDQNNNGMLDAGDVDNGDQAAVITVAASSVTGVVTVLDGSAALVAVSTSHYVDSSSSANDSYSINCNVRSNSKRVVNVYITGPQLSQGGIDLAARYWNEFSLWQNVNIRPQVDPADVYSFTVEYADGSETVYRPVTAVLDNPPTPLTPASDATNVANSGFTFTWNTPAGTTAANYSVRLNSPSGQNWWENWDVPGGTTTSTGYTGGLLPDGSYTWSVNLRDALGNEVGYQPGNLFTVGTGGGGGAGCTPAPEDIDGDCTLNINDADMDNDGVMNTEDNCPMVAGDVCDGGGDPGVTGTMTISGTVSYSGQSGQVYLRVSPWSNNDSGYGTSVWVDGSTGAPVSFTIRGVPADQYATYYLSAFMDTTASGIRSASNPALQSSFSSSQLGSVLALTLEAPTLPAPPQLGNQMFFIPGANGTGMIFFDRPEDNNVMVADSYNLYLGTSDQLTTSTNVELSISGIKNNEFDATLLKNLTPGATYYAIATTVVDGVESAASPLFSLVAAVPTGGETVSGTINFSGLDVPGLGGGKPAYVILHNSLQEADSRIAMVSVTSATAGTSFSIANVPDGAYDLYVILDTNDNQYVDLGDIVTTDAEALAVLVNSAESPENTENPVGSVTISAGPVAATAQVEHLDAAASWNQGEAMYCLDLDVEEKTRRPVNVALTSADAGMTDSIDLALSDWGSFGHFICASTAPTVGDTYSFAVTYADATTVTYDASVTAVLDSDSFATAVSPSGTVANATMPTFTWNPPQTPPVPFNYSVELQRQVNDPFGGGTHFEYLWEAWSIPSTQFSVAYDGEQPLTPGTYQWRLTVRDQNENEAVTAATFTVTDGSGGGTGMLAGQVTDESNNSDLPNVLVEIFTTPEYNKVGETQTAGDGTYFVSGLPAGGYVTSFSHLGFTSEFYDNQSLIGSAATVSVSTGAITTVDAALTPVPAEPGGTGAIVGQVTDELNTLGLPDVLVEIFTATPEHSKVDETQAAADGTYFVSGLPAGDYVTSFSHPGFISEFYNDQALIGSAAPVTVNAGALTTVNAALAPDNDNDGIADEFDNCPANYNPNQENNYGDLRGDACELNDGGGEPGGTGTTTLTGTVSYSGSRTGRVYIYASPWSGGGDGYGTSVAVNGNGTPVSFEIRGVPAIDQNSSYQLQAYMDTTGTGTRHAGDPAGTVQSSQTDGIALVLQNAEPQSAPAPGNIQILPGANGSALVFFDGPTTIGNNDYPLADSYDLCLKTSGENSMTNCAQLITGIKENDHDAAFVTGLTVGASYYAVMTATVSGVTSTPSITPAPVTIPVFSEGVTVSGTVSFPGVTLPGSRNIYMVLMDEMKPQNSRLAAIATTTNSKAFSLANVPAGSYKLYIILDMNDNNSIDEGDIMNGDAQAPFVTVTGAPLTLDPITVAAADVHPLAQTTHLDGSNSWYPGQHTYCVKVGIEDGTTHATSVAWLRGPDDIVDIARNQWGEYHLNLCGPPPPNVGDTFNYEATFADNSKKNYSAAVSAVLDSFAQLVSPVDIAVNEAMPHFIWQAPASGAPAQYEYALDLYKRVTDQYGTHDEYIWEAWSIPSSQTTIAYDGESISYDQEYVWSVKLRDQDGNTTITMASFTPTYDESLDTVAPTGTIVIDNGAAYTTASTVLLTFTATDASPAGVIAMMVSDNSNFTGSQWMAVVNELEVDVPAATTDGVKTVYVRYRDEAGNVSTFSDTIILDTTAPTGSVSINSGAAATNSGTVNLTLTGSGTPTEMRFSNDNTTWSDPENFAASKTGWLLESGDGSRSVYVQLQDAAGNISSATITAAIVVDSSAPLPGTVVINGGSAFTRLTTVTLTLGGASDLTPLKVQYSLNNGTTWSTLVDAPVSNTLTVTLPAGDSLKTVQVRYQDAGGNNSSVISDTITLDTTAPTGTVSINAGAAATSSEVLTLTLTANDPSSGVAEMMVSSNNSFTGATWESYSATRTLTLPRIDGLKTIYVRYRDVAGNISLDYSDTITLDTTAPTGSISINNGAAATSNETLTLAMAASDPGSGVAEMMVSSTSNSFTGAVWESYSATRTLTISQVDGLKTVYVKYRDVVGNISQVYSDTITYDAVPTGSVSINSNAGYTNKTAATLTLTRDSITTTQMRFRSYNGSAWGPWTAYIAYPASSTLPVTLAIGNGVRQVEVQYKDAAGNQSSELISDAINLDTTLPTGTLLIDEGARFNSVNLNLTLNASDSGIGASNVSKVLVAANSLFTSGLVEVDYVTHLAYALPLPTVDGLKTVYVKYKDNAGNFSPVYSKTITIDRVAPTGTLKIAAGAVATRLSTVTLTLTGLGAPTQMRFSNDNATWSGWETFLASKTGWALAPGEGSRSVYVQLRDAAGNISIATITDLINVDNSAPAPGAVVINAGSEFARLAAATLTLSGATDLSALKVQYSLNSGVTWSALVAVPVSNTLAVTLPAGSGLKTVQVRYTDAVGLVSGVISDTITLDTVAPVLAIGTKVKINGDAVTVDYSAAGGANGLLPLTLTVPAPTETGSGVAAIRWSVNGISWSSDQPWTDGSFALAFPLTLPPTLGVVKTLYIKVVDKVGNLSATYTDTIKVIP